MSAPIRVAQATGNNSAPSLIKVSKPQTNQAVTIHLDGPATIDLTAIGNDNVTFVHVGDRLIILFDNQSTVTFDPFYGADGAPSPTIAVELAAGRDVTSADFASLFPITSDQSILPAAGSPPSGAHFDTITISQFLADNPRLPLLGPEDLGGNGIFGPASLDVAHPGTQAPILGVHDVGGIEEHGIALGISAALGFADARTTLGNLTITGVPDDATLSAGIHNADGSWTVTPDQLAGLMLVSDGETQHFALGVTATALSGPVTESVSATFHVDVTPVADPPVLILGNGESERPTLEAVRPAADAFAFGREDVPIALRITAALAEPDADAVLTVTISGIPAGVTLSNAAHDVLTVTNGSVTLTPAQLVGLSLVGDGETQHFDLAVKATTVDGGVAEASTAATLHVEVTPVAEAPTLTVSADTHVAENATLGLTVTPLFETDADAVHTVTITGLGDARLSNAAGDLSVSDGAITLTPDQLAGLMLHAPDAEGTLTLTVTAHASEGGTTADSQSETLVIAIDPVADQPQVTVSAAETTEDHPGALVIGLGNAADLFEDNDDTVTVTVSLSDGATLLQDGTAVAGDTQGNFTLTAHAISDLANLSVQPAGGFEGQIGIIVSATTHDGAVVSTDGTATTTLMVDSVADQPQLTVIAAETTENNPGALTIGLGNADHLFEDATDSVTVTVSLSGRAALLQNGNAVAGDGQGNFTLTAHALSDLANLSVQPAGGFEGQIGIIVSATTHDGAVVSTDGTATTTLMVDSVADQPQLTVIAVETTENNPGALTIGLGNADHLFEDATDSVTVTVSLSGRAALLQNGNAVAGDGQGNFTLTAYALSDLANLSVRPASEFEGNIGITVSATAHDGAADSASVTAATILTVDSVADQPQVTVDATNTIEDRPGALSIGLTNATDLFEDPTDSVTVTVSLSGGATLLRNGNAVTGDGQ